MAHLAKVDVKSFNSAVEDIHQALETVAQQGALIVSMADATEKEGVVSVLTEIRDELRGFWDQTGDIKKVLRAQTLTLEAMAKTSQEREAM